MTGRQAAVSVGDCVVLDGDSKTVYRVTHVYRDGREVNLALPRTTLERFHVPVEDLRGIEQS